MKSSLPKIKSEFALLDVTMGRKALARMMPPGSTSLPNDERIPVTIRGWISHRHGNDDGISIEFGVDVETVEILEHMARIGPATVKGNKLKPIDKASVSQKIARKAKADRIEKGLRANREKKR